MNMAERQPSPERKMVYYAGMALMVVGFLCFGSVFVSGCLDTGRGPDFNFANAVSRQHSEAVRGILGMGMIIAGAFLRNAGRMGLAGSGIKLDPEEARKDVEPWARMGGGVLKDVLDEAGISPGGKPPASNQLPFDERLRRLQKLRQDGILNEEEYETAKKKILEQA